jgi:hypothetical protein
VGSDQQQAAQVNWVVTKPFTMNRIIEIVHEVAQRKTSVQERDGQLVAA